MLTKEGKGAAVVRRQTEPQMRMSEDKIQGGAKIRYREERERHIFPGKHIMVSEKSLSLQSW